MSKKRKLVTVGFMARCNSMEGLLVDIAASFLFEKKGVKSDFPDFYWPPRKVRVTVEEI